MRPDAAGSDEEDGRAHGADGRNDGDDARDDGRHGAGEMMGAPRGKTPEKK